MSDDPFFERLRAEASHLRYEPADDVVFTRLSARIREQILAPATVSQFLSQWFRPLAASLAAVAFVSSLGVSWLIQAQDATSTDPPILASVQVSMDGDTYLVGE